MPFCFFAKANMMIPSRVLPSMLGLLPRSLKKKRTGEQLPSLYNIPSKKIKSALLQQLTKKLGLVDSFEKKAEYI